MKINTQWRVIKMKTSGFLGFSQLEIPSAELIQSVKQFPRFFIVKIVVFQHFIDAPEQCGYDGIIFYDGICHQSLL